MKVVRWDEELWKNPHGMAYKEHATFRYISYVISHILSCSFTLNGLISVQKKATLKDSGYVTCLFVTFPATTVRLSWGNKATRQSSGKIDHSLGQNKLFKLTRAELKVVSVKDTNCEVGKQFHTNISAYFNWSFLRGD